MKFKKLLITIITLVSICSCAQKSMFIKAEKEDTLEAYDKYLKKYPDGKYSEKAKFKIEHLEYVNAIVKANEKNSTLPYDEYLINYPNGKYSRQAREEIEKLEYVNARVKSKNENTIQPYENYLKKYPDGKYAKKVSDEIIYFEYLKMIEMDSIDVYKSLIEKYPMGECLRRIRSKVERKEFEKAKATNTIEAYKLFMEKFPNSSLFKAAEEEYLYLECTETKDYKTIKNFLSLFPKSKYFSTINLLNEKMSKKLKLEFAGVVKNDKTTEYNKFIIKYPASTWDEEFYKYAYPLTIKRTRKIQEKLTDLNFSLEIFNLFKLLPNKSVFKLPKIDEANLYIGFTPENIKTSKYSTSGFLSLIAVLSDYKSINSAFEKKAIKINMENPTRYSFFFDILDYTDKTNKNFQGNYTSGVSIIVNLYLIDFDSLEIIYQNNIMYFGNAYGHPLDANKKLFSNVISQIENLE